jgi:phosphate transport system permease protein
MATDTGSEAAFGRVSRLQGLVFEQLTRVAAFVGVVALFLLFYYTVRDAVQPATADPGWYAVLAVTFLAPTAAVSVVARRRPGATRVALRAVGAVLAGLALATVFVLWLSANLTLAVLVGCAVPTAAAFAFAARRRRGALVAVRALGVVLAGLGVAGIGAGFLGEQATLVGLVTVGVPLGLLGRYFLARPPVGAVGVRALAAATLGAMAALLALGTAATFGVDLGSAGLGEGGAAGVVALASVVGVGVVAVRARDHHGRAGLFAPFVALAPALAGYLFHREFVVTAGLTPALYGVAVGLPFLAFAATVVRSDEEDATGLAVPVVAAAGLGAAAWFHRNFVVTAPDAELAFGLALALTFGAYAWYVLTRDPEERDVPPGRIGLLVPVVAGVGLLAGLAGAEQLGFAAPDVWLDVGFLTSGSHYDPTQAGIHPALVGTLYLMAIVAFVSFPLGVGAAVYLEEYATNDRFTRLIEVNVANLAGVPSVVYGLLGVAVFIRSGGLGIGAVLAGGLTLSLLILPIVIVTAQEAIRAVPDSLRRASYGMGATRWQTVRNVVLPEAMPGILTGTILALGRAVGETAPILMVGLAAFAGVPEGLTAQGTAMPLRVFEWALHSNDLIRTHVAAAGSMTLLVALVAMNGVAILLRNKYQRDQ